MSTVKIGILGSGNMGRSIGIRFVQLGHDVLFGGRSPNEAPRRAAEQATSVSKTVANAKYGSLEDAAWFGDVLIWTSRETDPKKALTTDGVAALDGKIVVDVNNRDFAIDVMGEPTGQGGRWFEKSLAEQLAANLPRANVVKALNTIAMETFDTSPARLREAGAQAFVAGATSKEGKETVLNLVQSLGFEAVDLGEGPNAVRIAEAIADVYRYLIGHGASLNSNLGFRALPVPDLGAIGDRQISGYH